MGTGHGRPFERRTICSWAVHVLAAARRGPWALRLLSPAVVFVRAFFVSTLEALNFQPEGLANTSAEARRARELVARASEIVAALQPEAGRARTCCKCKCLLHAPTKTR